jgi:hypothetical protein
LCRYFFCLRTSTPAHLNLIFECVGQALGLPITDQKSTGNIRSVVELYRRWLLDPARPPAVEQDEQATFCVCLQVHSDLKLIRESSRTFHCCLLLE